MSHHVYDKKTVEEGVGLILKGLGVDLKDENFTDTPSRVARAFKELCSGLYETPESKAAIFGKRFKSPYKGMLLVGPISAHGVCPHHLLPVKMTVVLAYLPGEEKLGLSKLARAVKMFAARPLMQETVSHELVEAFADYVKPQGVALYINGSHGCMTARGVNLPDCTATTMDVRGMFEKDEGIKTEFQRLLALKLNGTH
jgi:GTP cyclohydrolase IA